MSRRVSISVQVFDEGAGVEGTYEGETFDLESLIGTSQDAQDGCDPCEFGTEILTLVIQSAAGMEGTD
jgi:hypothetical protein